MQKTMTLYDANANVVGGVTADERVACLDGTYGHTRNYLNLIYYAEKRTEGWDNVIAATVKYRFVDTGLRINSSTSEIALYGNW